MERKVIIRRKEVLNHLPKEIRAGAKVKLGSMYVDRLPLKGVDGEEEAKLLKNFMVQLNIDEMNVLSILKDLFK